MIYIVLLLISFSLTYLIKNYAIKKSLLAQVNERSSHTVPTPHGGGVAIVVTWLIGLVYLQWNNEIEATLFYALLCGFFIAAVGFLDDIFELKASLRVGLNAIVAALGLYLLGGLHSITFGIWEVTDTFVLNLFAFLLILWYINLTNFIDGINGYVGCEMIFLSLAGTILFGGGHFIVLCVAVLGFLYWNFGNAKIFMGDVGSTLLGYTVAIITIYYANAEPVNLWVWIILFGVFWFDATLTLLRRKKSGATLSVAHKKHAYQRLTQVRWSHRKVTFYGAVLNIIIFLLVYCIPNIAISFALSLLLLYGAMRFVDNKKKFE